MPFITLNGLGHDSARVFALMCFPNDESVQKQFLAIRTIEKIPKDADPQETFPISVAELRMLAASPSQAEIYEQVSEAVKRAVTAGDILSIMYLMDKFSEQNTAFKKPSFNRALHVSMKFSLTARYGDGTVLPRSEQTIRKNWKEFRSVSHLWAALRIDQDYPFMSKIGPFDDGENFQRFLGLALEIGRFATSYCPDHTKLATPLIDPESLWLPPSSVKPFTPDFDIVPDALLKYLGTYKAG